MMYYIWYSDINGHRSMVSGTHYVIRFIYRFVDNFSISFPFSIFNNLIIATNNYSTVKRNNSFITRLRVSTHVRYISSGYCSSVVFINHPVTYYIAVAALLIIVCNHCPDITDNGIMRIHPYALTNNR